VSRPDKKYFQLFSKIQNITFVETGAYMGDGIAEAIECGFSKIISIEPVSEFLRICAERFENEIETGRLSLFLGGSETHLKIATHDIDGPVCFWLDAHWQGQESDFTVKNCPVKEEVSFICKDRLKNAQDVVLIDDVRLLRKKDAWCGHDVVLEDVVEQLKIAYPDHSAFFIDGYTKDDVFAMIPNSLKIEFLKINNDVSGGKAESLSDARNAEIQSRFSAASAETFGTTTARQTNPKLSKNKNMPFIKVYPADRRKKKSIWLMEHARNITSQFGQDGIIREILNRIGIRNKVCCEFGAWDGKRHSNTYSLIADEGWTGYLIEGSSQRCQDIVANHKNNPRAIAINAWVGFEGNSRIDAILQSAAAPTDLDLMIIDIDGNDYHVWHSMINYRPRLLLAEFNPTIPNEVEFIQARDNKTHQGCSLRALINLSKAKGYELVAAHRDAYFVLKEDFYKFDIQDNSIDAMHFSDRILHLFHGYDGKFWTAGNRRMYWCGGKQIAPDELQPVSPAQSPKTFQDDSFAVDELSAQFSRPSHMRKENAQPHSAERIPLTKEPLWRHFPITENQTYNIMGRIIYESENDMVRNACLARIRFFDSEGIELPAPYEGVSISQAVGPYQYLNVCNTPETVNLLSLKAPNKANKMSLGFQLWSARQPAYISAELNAYEQNAEMKHPEVGPAIASTTMKTISPPDLMPPDVEREFTMGGVIPVRQLYFDQRQNRAIILKKKTYEQVFSKLEKGTFQYYGDTLQRLLEALRDFSVIDMKVVVFGSNSVNCDAIALKYGAKRVCILEYNVPISEHPSVKCLSLRSALDRGMKFDAGISISSFEHDGLGRYGDPINPDGDLRAMEEAKRLIKPGGLLYLSVPVGADCVLWNAGRIYGHIRLPLILEGWKQEAAYGFDKTSFNKEIGNYDNQPVFVLRNQLSDENQNEKNITVRPLKNRYVLVKVCYGMGGRLRVVADALEYARKTDRRLIVDWNDGYYDDGKNDKDVFSQYFIYPKSNCIEFYDILKNAGNKIKIYPCGWHVRSVGLGVSYSLDSTLYWALYKERPPREDVDADVVVFTWHNVPMSMSKQTSELYREFKLQPKIVEKIDRFASDKFKTPPIGVHVRHGNGERRVIAPEIDWFIDKIEEIRKEDENTPIFLCTDSIFVQEYFLNKFDNVCYTEKKFPLLGPLHNNPMNKDCPFINGEQALVDMYLLARCDVLLLTGYHFARTALLLGGGKKGAYQYPNATRLLLKDAPGKPISELKDIKSLLEQAGIHIDNIRIDGQNGKYLVYYGYDQIATINDSGSIDIDKIKSSLLRRRLYV
jgi:SAM-dependent methyltransferase